GRTVEDAIRSGDTHHGFGITGWGASGGIGPGAQEHGPVEPPIPAPVGPEGSGGAPRPESGDPTAYGSALESPGGADEAQGAAGDGAADGGTRKGPPPRGTDVPPGVRSRGGFTAWARRLTGGRGEPGDSGRDAYEQQGTRPASAPYADPA